MSEVDLNQKKESVTLTLGDKKFTVRRVVTGVLQLYGEFARDQGEMLERIGHLQTDQERLEKISPEEISQEELDELDKTSQELVDEVEEFSKAKIDRLLRMIQLLLEKNGYEYDREWWIENADVSDYQNFIVACINKDVPAAGGVKKNKAVVSTGTDSR
jgi:mevalonate kinase